ncbi:phosphatidylglycerophosphatase B [Erwinia tasmaniensis]|uniref:phosphatidylglycerophosphatase B n=1 Tax=Erwinia tasmaniensis TaxID=338565 RepID=UPI003A4E41E0
MFSIAKRTTLGALLLLIMPVGVWLSGWRWQPVEMGLGYKLLFGLTETVTSPWGTLTSLLLCGWFLWCLRFRLKPAVVLLLIVSASLMAGQYAKTFIKREVQEPRPYVLWLEKSQGLNEKTFYEQTRRQRSAMVTQAMREDSQLPEWLKRHWAFETGYAFPSGHTMFAATWALLAVGLLWPRRHRITVAVILLWATGVMGSRLALGMHWPRDLITSTIISWLLVMLATWLVQRFCGPLTVLAHEQKEMAKREQQ